MSPVMVEPHVARTRPGAAVKRRKVKSLIQFRRQRRPPPPFTRSRLPHQTRRNLRIPFSNHGLRHAGTQCAPIVARNVFANVERVCTSATIGWHGHGVAEDRRRAHTNVWHISDAVMVRRWITFLGEQRQKRRQNNFLSRRARTTSAILPPLRCTHARTQRRQRLPFCAYTHAHSNVSTWNILTSSLCKHEHHKMCAAEHTENHPPPPRVHNLLSRI